MSNIMNFPILNVLKQSKNPNQAIQNILAENAKTNPLLMNVLQLSQKGDYKSLEQIARNLCKERGINPDELIKDINSIIH